MRRLVFIVLLLSLIGGSLYLGMAGSSRPPLAPAELAVVGEPAPNFTLQDAYGKSYTLAELRDKVVMINFWATWCPPCRAEMPSMEKLNRLMAGEDFIMLAVNIESNGRQVVPQFMEKVPHSFPVLFDEQGVVQQLYGVYKFPETYIVRKDGIIDDKVIGAIDWAHPETVAYFRSLAQE